jgi:hypothetical protein
MSSRARMMGAGNAGSTVYKTNVNLNTFGGNKKQGITSRVGLDHWANTAVQTYSNGYGRNKLFCMNQLGGVGAGKSMFNGRFTQTDGVHCPIQESEALQLTLNDVQVVNGPGLRSSVVEITSNGFIIPRVLISCDVASIQVINLGGFISTVTSTEMNGPNQIFECDPFNLPVIFQNKVLTATISCSTIPAKRPPQATSDYVMIWEIDPSQPFSLTVASGGSNSRPSPGQTITPGNPYTYCIIDGWINVNIFQSPNGIPNGKYISNTNIKLINNVPVSCDSNDQPNGVLLFTYIGTQLIDGQLRYEYTIVLSPQIIPNAGWNNGLDNDDATLITPNSYWVQDYGAAPGRWTTKDNAIFQSTNNLNGTGYGSRAYPVRILNNNYAVATSPYPKAELASGTAYEGVWQICIKIGSNGLGPFCETFYLAERKNLIWTPGDYLDGSPAGGDGGYGREIDIMETKWKDGPQVNIPNGGGTGWNPSDTICTSNGIAYVNWSAIGGAPTSDFVTFGVLIRDNKLWFYAYHTQGTVNWYATNSVPKNNAYVQQGPFVPYIGTWTDVNTPGGFETGYKNFVYLPPDDPKINGKNPYDNPEAFGAVLI